MNNCLSVVLGLAMMLSSLSCNDRNGGDSTAEWKIPVPEFGEWEECNNCRLKLKEKWRECDHLTGPVCCRELLYSPARLGMPKLTECDFDHLLGCLALFNDESTEDIPEGSSACRHRGGSELKAAIHGCIESLELLPRSKEKIIDTIYRNGGPTNQATRMELIATLTLLRYEIQQRETQKEHYVRRGPNEKNDEEQSGDCVLWERWLLCSELNRLKKKTILSSTFAVEEYRIDRELETIDWKVTAAERALRRARTIGLDEKECAEMLGSKWVAPEEGIHRDDDPLAPM
jgi:hypothetical protein